MGQELELLDGIEEERGVRCRHVLLCVSVDLERWVDDLCKVRSEAKRVVRERKRTGYE